MLTPLDLNNNNFSADMTPKRSMSFLPKLPRILNACIRTT